jgi:hypothetical protein
MIQDIQFFTIVARNYLAYAYVLGTSVKQHHPDAVFSVFVMDDVKNAYTRDIEAKGFIALGPKDICIDHYEQFVFKYNITEASTAVKPFVMQHLYESGAKKVIYLDPDIFCYRRFDEVLEALDNHAIVLTPHSASPINPEYFPDDKLFLSSGVYNLGFIGTSNGDTTRHFLKWWRERLYDDCLDATEINLFVDQKWVDLVPAYFDRVCILKNPAYNIAYWNLHERTIESVDGTLHVLPANIPVAFIHFSGIVIDGSGQISKYGPRSPFTTNRQIKRYSLQDRPDLTAPLNTYIEHILAAGMKMYSALPYAYSTYTNGEKISQLERALYHASEEWHNMLDPFQATQHSFWRACRKAGIRVSTSTDNRDNVGDLEYKYKLIFNSIQTMLRMVIKLLGPELYAKFAKYMRQQLLLNNHDFLLKRDRST